MRRTVIPRKLFLCHRSQEVQWAVLRTEVEMTVVAVLVAELAHYSILAQVAVYLLNA